MHRCPDCGERFEGNICTFCGRPVPQEELEQEKAVQEKAVQEKSDEQANINNSEEVSKSAVENTALNSAGVQPVNEYAQNGYSTQSVNNYAQKNYNSQHSYGNPNYNNSAMPSGYTNQNQPFSDVVNTREKKKSKTTLIVVLVIVSVLIISLCVVGYTVIMNVIKNNKFNMGIGEFTGADDSAAVSSVSMDLDENSYCFYTENDDGTVTVTGIDTVDYYNEFTDEVVDDTYNFYFNIPSEINGKTVTAIGKINPTNPLSSGTLHIYITVPGTVKTIQSDTFKLSENVCEITFEDGVETLEPDAIVDCYSLDRVNIPESVTVIGEHAVGFYIAGDTFSEPVGKREYTRSPLTHIYAKEGSAADRYAKDNDLYIEYN